jgi:multisubunit Na+/H+ antiporter MnhE subunit
MLHAAAMLIGLFVLGILLAGRGFAPDVSIAAGVVALACVAFCVQFGGLSRAAFSAPQLAWLALSRTGAVVRGALTTMRAAIAADVTLNPALVRVRTRATDPFAKAALAELMSAAPGVVVVEADVDSALVHVNDEDGVDAADIGALEARVIGALGNGAVR